MAMAGFARRTAEDGCPHMDFIRATSQLNAGTILGPGFFRASGALNPK